MIDGSTLGLVWLVPFVGMLLSVALVPLLLPHIWHRHFKTIAAFWSVVFAAPFLALNDFDAASGALVHTIALDYVPFIILLTALFTVAGGIRLTGTIRGTPGVNTLLLAIGSGLASIMGTTGAAMLIVRPLIRANRRRRHKTHVFIFLIFLVANIGGALTPLGDPPLLIGFLQGVPFFWPTVHLFQPMLFLAVILLGIFYAVDHHLHRRGYIEEPSALEEIERLGIDGKQNLPLLALIPLVVLIMGSTRDLVPSLEFHHLSIDLASLLGNLALVAITVASLRLTSRATHRANEFSWFPMVEVGWVFAAIFITVVPALTILRTGEHGALAPVVELVAPHGKPVDAIYFWVTGGLSSLLDNAPTYLISFNLAGGNATALTGPLASTLAAISAGAVFMGANSYIGNAPNFMVKAVCEHQGIAMPSFFGYMAWAAVVLLPLFVAVTLIFFR